MSFVTAPEHVGGDGSDNLGNGSGGLQPTGAVGRLRAVTEFGPVLSNANLHHDDRMVQNLGIFTFEPSIGDALILVRPLLLLPLEPLYWHFCDLIFYEG